MKKIVFIVFLFFVFTQQLQAQTKKVYCYIETEFRNVIVGDNFDWKPSVPYKHFVRLISEVIEVPDNYYIREQFYEYVMKNYLSDLKKLRLHKEFVSIYIFDYLNPNEPVVGNGYNQQLNPKNEGRFPFEVILVKGFKYNPNNKGPWPLLENAKKIVMEGKD